MTHPLDSLRLMSRLGIGHSGAVLRHRRRIKKGYYVKRLPIKAALAEPLWDVTLKPGKPHAKLLAKGNAIANQGAMVWVKGVYVERQGLHFSQVAVNDVKGEDVKLSWNTSRFEWVTQLALAALHSEEPNKYLAKLHALTNDWLSKHDHQAGVLWNCSQEVSLRGLHVMLTTELLGAKPSKALLDLLEQSFLRVRATLRYAVAQQNNHSFTEMLFLFYAERFLNKYGVIVENAPSRERVIALVKRLIQPDGSCSMPSLNYHRVFCDIASLFAILDTYLHIGLWKDGTMRVAVTRMCKFLESVIEPISGGVPNIGHNDGSLHCIQFTPPKDYIPSLLLMSAVFALPIPLRFKKHMDSVYLFGRNPHFADLPPVTRFDDFGIIIVDKPAYRAYLKYPRNRFRPLQADFGHLDVWVNGANVLHDSGTFSYNPPAVDDFDDAQAHNVPLPLDKPFVTRRSQFLYNFWPHAHVETKTDEVSLQVSNGHGVTLSRRVHFGATSITLEDAVAGAEQWGSSFNFPGAMTGDTFREGRWHLAPNVTLMTPDASEQKISSPGFAPWYQEKAASCRILVSPEEGNTTLVCDIIIG